MYLYNLTLQRPTGICVSVHGNFSGTKQQEIAVSRGKSLDLLKPDPTTGKVYTLVSTDIFGVIRSMMPFRLTGGSKDYLVIGSDSGRIAVLEYNQSKNCFERVHLETFGKSGCRRIVPGQYLAMDPKGRAVMIAGLEKQKLVYIFNRDSQARLTISSPLEAHKSNTVVYHIVGVDVGFENPLFACLEIDYEESDADPSGAAFANTRQLLTFYELDLGLNHVVRKYSEPLDFKANMILPVPGGNDGPSGVLICAENYLIYKNSGDQPDIKCPIPRRKNDLDDPERSMLFICSASHKTKSMFFVLLQTEQGDIFKATLEVDGDMVTEIRLKYFDTVPIASSMNVLKTGFLFVASEFGSHNLYQIAHLGDDDGEPEFSSSIPLDEGETFFFAPRPLKNLQPVDELDSLCPIVQCQISDLANEDTPQLYTLCGKGPKSSLKVLRHGLEVSEMAVSELPGNPNAVWTVKKRSDDAFDAYIIVSFVNATLVLSIAETVEEVTDSGFLGTTPTLSCSQLGEDALLQVYPDGIRHIRADRRVNEWRTPGKRTITKCAVNHRQVVIALTGGELVYFEMDLSGQLNEYTERKQMTKDVVCMGLGRVPSGEQRCRFLAVGLADNTVRIISLDPADCLTPLSTQALPAPPESLCILEMGGSEESDNSAAGLFLFIGLQNGVLLRTKLDPVTGDLSDTRTRYLGSRPVKLHPISVQGHDAVLAVSSRSWLCYWYQNRFHLTPLSYEALDYASGFASEQCPEGIVAICTSTLRILALEKLGVQFNQVSHPLPFTPRKFIIHTVSGNLIIICADHNAFTEEVKKQRKHQMAEEMVAAAGPEEQSMAAELAGAFLNEDLPEDIFNPPKAGTGWWASCVIILQPHSGMVLQRIELEQNEAAHSLSVVKFASDPENSYVLVGTVKDLILNPRQCSGGFIHTYKLVDSGSRLEEVHITPVEDAPMAICGFQGRALVGVGKLLRLYDLGKKKLLRKSENRRITNMVMGLWPAGKRCFVGDVQDSFSVLTYKPADNQLSVFADDGQSRWLSTATVLDQDTIAGADKFGSIFITRLEEGTQDDVDEDPSGAKALWDRGNLNGSAQKTQTIASFHVGEIVTSMQRATLIPGGNESLVYTTLNGTIGMLVPFTSKDEYEFFQHLEMHVRQEMPTMCGREHMAFRSYFAPVKATIDGDLCELFTSLELSKQKAIAGELDKTPNQVSKKLEDIRTRFGF